MAKGHLVGESAFFFHRARRILFRQDEKEWGVHSHGKAVFSGEPPGKTGAAFPNNPMPLAAPPGTAKAPCQLQLPNRRPDFLDKFPSPVLS
jgi:hypothetical protein